MSKFVPQLCCAFSSLLLAEIARLNAEEQENDSAQRVYVSHVVNGLQFRDYSGKRNVKVEVWRAVSVDTTFDHYVDGQFTQIATTSDVERIAQKIINFFKDDVL